MLLKLRIWDEQLSVMKYSDTAEDWNWDMVVAAQKKDQVMVCTGLTDASGRLLYEGDYVRVFNTYKELPYNAQLIYKNAQFVLETETLTTHNRWINYELQYIGNHFETPGLLQQSNG